jgi:manganese/zinc/iron transport system permease protein
MNHLLEFLSFSQPNVRLVALGSMLLGAAAGVVGCFAYLRKQSLVGDAVAHAILPGIVTAFVIGENKHPAYLVLGALISGWIAVLSIDYLTNKTKLKSDTVIGLVLSVFFGLGIFMLTAVQHTELGNQAGLDKFLFGKAASMSPADVNTFGLLAIVILVTVLFFFKTFKVVTFNRDYALALGLPVRTAEFTLSTLTVLAIITGIQAVGVVLMAALLITPAAAARSWSNRLVPMLAIAAGIGSFGGLAGSYISYLAPKMPTGPWIVIVISAVALFSLLFAPNRGVLAKLQRQRKNQQKILTENVLKALYQLQEKMTESAPAFTQNDIVEKRAFTQLELNVGLNILKRKNEITKVGNAWQLTAKGTQNAQRVVRLHRLWEMYLTQRMNMQEDHIHPNAETMEHIITPELEAELIRELNKPEKDPHQSVIPYDK